MNSRIFDPLKHKSPANLSPCDSYWASTVSLGEANKSLRGSQTADVAIIGGGYTGLLTAHYLAERYNVDVCVLEANQVGFGASARNAGFVLKGAGRLGYSQMAKRWDLNTAKGIYNEFSQAVERVEGLIQDYDIKCDPQPKGYIKVAHNPKALTQLRDTASFISTHLGEDAQFIDASTLKNEYMDHHQAYGALRLEDGFGVNPLKLLLGYKSLLNKQSVTLCEHSCVEGWIEENGKHRLITSEGELRVNKVITAGNAYTPNEFNPRIDNRFLPILSNVIVTEPLTEDELVTCGLKTHQVTMDTRILKYYYRLLPDNRLLFGGRGAIWGRDAYDAVFQRRLKIAMTQCFPSLANKSIAYNWTGWIAATLDDMPHVFCHNSVGYSLGYCGSGVSFSTQAAFRLAQQITGHKVPSLPLYDNELPKFPLPKFRRVGQWGYYHYGWLRDRFL
ncbi:oxidoreductase [Shewanella sp. GutCb]|uniref:NAD(P)/FAD-dependent oxidoreductase n=1 Tax=Shewanella sp. GutCb TaxID=2058315 RepID=UPI000C7B2418|nr:FAD-binding oxidoreductase [Shewanella sp. GutCb]PKG75336.1 oxidoreductase [Shewanella sp. GutCb]